MQRPQQYSDHTLLPGVTWLRQLGCLLCCSCGLGSFKPLCAPGASIRCPLHSMQDMVDQDSWLTKLVLGTAAPCQHKRQDQHHCAVWRHASDLLMDVGLPT